MPATYASVTEETPVINDQQLENLKLARLDVECLATQLSQTYGHSFYTAREMVASHGRPTVCRYNGLAWDLLPGILARLDLAERAVADMAEEGLGVKKLQAYRLALEKAHAKAKAGQTGFSGVALAQIVALTREALEGTP